MTYCDAVGATHCTTVGATHCTTPHLNDEQIKAAFVSMVNGMLEGKDEIMAFYDEFLAKLTDTTALEAEKVKRAAECEVVSAELREWIKEYARRAMSKQIYDARYEELAAKIDALKGKLCKTEDEILRRAAKRTNAMNIMARLRETVPMVAFDEDMFGALVDCVTVYRDRLVFALKDGTERIVMN